MGASNVIRPSSTSIIAASDVTGLVMDARRKIVSGVASMLLPAALLPNASRYKRSQALATEATTHGTSPRVTHVLRKSEIVCRPGIIYNWNDDRTMNSPPLILKKLR